MKKLIAMITALAALFAAQTVMAESDGYFVLCKPGSIVNARFSPNTRADVVGRYECGDYVRTDGEEKNGFVHIVDCSLECSDAWISKRYLVESEPRACNLRVIVIASGRVAARAWVDGKRNGWLKPGQEVTIYAQSDEWCVTNRGYVRTEFLGVN